MHLVLIGSYFYKETIIVSPVFFISIFVVLYRLTEGKTYGIGTWHVCVTPTKKMFHELPPFHFRKKGNVIPHRKRFFMASWKDVGFRHFFSQKLYHTKSQKRDKRGKKKTFSYPAFYEN